ncbi:MAG: diguanylate cyclase [Campylobacterota bacterium]|nr:diguanylate cyclase [Campylobacterota bacterium]
MWECPIYQARKTTSEALKEIESLQNIHFKKEIVDAAIKSLDNLVLDKKISQLPSSKIEKERFSYFYKDQITQSYNSTYLDFLLVKNSFNIKYKYIFLISIHNLNNINEKFGWEEGNKYLQNISLKLQNIYDDDLIFRIYSDDFLILSTKKIVDDSESLKKFICRDGLDFETKKYNIEEDSIFSFHDLELLK